MRPFSIAKHVAALPHRRQGKAPTSLPVPIRLEDFEILSSRLCVGRWGRVPLPALLRARDAGFAVDPAEPITGAPPRRIAGTLSASGEPRRGFRSGRARRA